ncbi:hypothetical protein PM082_020317 [Marasmius tenuissimus]|nr:hypothetical protein PM082_020317 [Marasmius tenuissimus]
MGLNLQNSHHEIDSSYGSSIPHFGDDTAKENHKIPTIVDMAIEIEKERKKALEAMNARDATVGRLGEAYTSLRQKTALLERLQKENIIPHDLTSKEASRSNDQEEVVKLKHEVLTLEGTVNTLKEEIKVLKESSNKPGLAHVESFGNKNGIEQDYFNSKTHFNALVNPFMYHTLTPPALSRHCSQNSITSSVGSTISGTTTSHPEGGDFMMFRGLPSTEAEDLINARNKLLEAIPLPEDTPDDVLRPIALPPNSTLNEFLSSAPAHVRHMLPNYHTLHDITTSWCPQREEHGYFLTPVFKCNTNPRVTSAHCWSEVDIFGNITKPTDCFYNRDGTWYYAGVYQAFRLDDITAKEWEALSNETTQFLVKDTLSGRKNISPQNVYEVGQLYAAGALRIACIGLQCIGFNKLMYNTLLEYVDMASQLGQNKSRPIHERGGSRDIIDSMANMKIAGRGAE